MPIAKELASNGVNYHHFSFEKGNPDLDAEVSYQIDLCLEWHFQDWAFQVSPFLNYFPNYIYLNPTSQHDYSYGAGNQVFEYTQNKVLRTGGEVHTHINLTGKLKTGAIVEYVYSNQLSGQKKGFSLPFSPPTKFLLNLKYSFNDFRAFRQSFISTDYWSVLGQGRIVPPERKTPGYGLVNISVGSNIVIGKTSFMLTVQLQNALNSKYFNHTSFYRLINIPGPGRNLAFSIKIPFKMNSSNDNN